MNPLSRIQAKSIYDIEAEACALGCVLLADENSEAILGDLEPEFFHDLRHQRIFGALCSLAEDRETLDVVNLYERLKCSGDVVEAGELAYISQLPDKPVSSANFASYLGIIKDRAARRQMLAEAERLVSDALDLGKPNLALPKKRKLPAAEDAAVFTQSDLTEPDQLICGVLHRGCKMVIGGGSKTFKSWSLIDLALSISHNEPWLSFKTTRARVCYVNLELPSWSLHSRIKAVARDKQIQIQPNWLQVWNLRGHSVAAAELVPQLSAELNKSNLGLIIIDPVYKLLGNADENSARDINGLLNWFEMLARETGAAIAFASHFSKGNQASKESVDRISGSGVFARDPDAILTFTRHEAASAFVVDSTLRNCPAIDPFVARWQYPLMRRSNDLDPTKLKQPNRGGRTASFTVEMIVDCLGQGKLTTAQWQKRCFENAGITRPTFYRLMKDAEKEGIVEKGIDEKWFVSKVSKGGYETSESIKSHISLGYETDTDSEISSIKTRKKAVA